VDKPILPSLFFVTEKYSQFAPAYEHRLGGKEWLRLMPAKVFDEEVRKGDPEADFRFGIGSKGRRRLPELG